MVNREMKKFANRNDELTVSDILCAIASGRKSNSHIPQPVIAIVVESGALITYGMTDIYNEMRFFKLVVLGRRRYSASLLMPLNPI